MFSVTKTVPESMSILPLLVDVRLSQTSRSKRPAFQEYVGTERTDCAALSTSVPLLTVVPPL